MWACAFVGFPAGRRGRRPLQYTRDFAGTGGFRGWGCLLRPSIRPPELVEGSHRSAKVAFFEKRFFDSAVATLRMTKARVIVRTRVVSVRLYVRLRTVEDAGPYDP